MHTSIANESAVHYTGKCSENCFYPESLGIIAFNFLLRCSSLFISTYFVHTPSLHAFRPVNEASSLNICTRSNATSLCLPFKTKISNERWKMINYQTKCKAECLLLSRIYTCAYATNVCLEEWMFAIILLIQHCRNK